MKIASLASMTIFKPRFSMSVSKFFKNPDFVSCLSTKSRNRNRPKTNIPAAPKVLPKLAIRIPGKNPNKNPAEMVIRDAGKEKTPKRK